MVIHKTIEQMKKLFTILLHRFSAILIVFGTMGLLCLFSCEEEIHKPLSEGIKPAVVSNVEVENRNGEAVITYSLPNKGAFYVVAEYEPRPGLKKQVKSSVYKQELVLNGFEKAQEYEVKVYVVGVDEQRSEAIKVKVNPLTPPYIITFNSLEAFEDWGGISVKANNELNNKLVFGVFALDSIGLIDTLTMHYTEQSEVKFAFRGLESKMTTFGIFVRDAWENFSDTMYVDLKPLFEEELDRSKFKQVDLPTDMNLGHTAINTPMHRMWNDVVSNRDDLFLTRPNAAPIPQWFTFDIAKKSKLSRMKLWHRATFLFEGGNPKRFEVYGSNDPNPDGSWESWELLGYFESKKPSGLPIGQLTNEDIEYINAGEEFVFGLDTPPVRYLRFKTLEVWGGVQYVSIQMMKIWGEVVE